MYVFFYIPVKRVSLWKRFFYSYFDSMNVSSSFSIFSQTRRYGTLRRPTYSSCGGLRPSAEGFFCPSGKKTNHYAFFWANFRQFLFPVVTLVTLKRIQKVQKKLGKLKKIKKIQKKKTGKSRNDCHVIRVTVPK